METSHLRLTRRLQTEPINQPSDFPHTDEATGDPSSDDNAVDRRRFLTTGAFLVGAAALGSRTLVDAATKNKPTNTKTAKLTAAKALTPAANCAIIPQETGGPFPGNGANGPNVLTQDGVVRRDIRSSFGQSTTRAPGLATNVTMRVMNTSTCKPFAGAAVYIWHCDRDGNYSMYDDATVNENFCRGVQVADADGLVTFTTVFPGAYPGRWPHIHLEVYPTLALATTAENAISVSQLAYPADVCRQVYRATKGYEASARELSRSSLSRDTVFADNGAKDQLATMSGSLAKTLTASLLVSV